MDQPGADRQQWVQQEQKCNSWMNLLRQTSTSWVNLQDLTKNSWVYLQENTCNRLVSQIIASGEKILLTISCPHNYDLSQYQIFAGGELTLLTIRSILTAPLITVTTHNVKYLQVVSWPLLTICSTLTAPLSTVTSHNIEYLQVVNWSFSLFAPL